MSNTMTHPKLSVILPVYNSENYLKEAISSVLNQNLRDFELIIINDGSTDSSLDIIKDFSLQDARIVLVDKENSGLVDTLNLGLTLAKAEYIARMDSDDICLPDRFQKQTEFLDTHASCIAVGSRVFVIDSEGDTLCDHWWSLVKHSDIDSANLSGETGSAMCHPSVIFRKSAVLTIGGYSKEYPHAEDLDLFLKLAEIGQLANISDCLLKYRIHLKSVSQANKRVQLESTWKAIAAARERRHMEPISRAETEADDPSNGNLSIDARYVSWGWIALQGGNNSTAFKYCRKLLISKAYELETWRLIYGLFKYSVLRINAH